MTIGELARATGAAPSQIRYYERLGVLPPAGRSATRRVYGPEAIGLVRAALVARRLGFRVRDLIAMRRDGGAAAAAQRRIAELTAEIRRARVARALTAHFGANGAIVPDRYARILDAANQPHPAGGASRAANRSPWL